MSGTYIILDADQASQVRGASAAIPTSRLRPIALNDGTFALGVDVLDDPAHAQHRELLAGLQTVDLATVQALLPPAREGDQ